MWSSSSSDGRTASELSGNFNGEKIEETVADVDGSTVVTIGLSFSFIFALEAQFVLGAISAEGSLSDSEDGFAWTFALHLARSSPNYSNMLGLFRIFPEIICFIIRWLKNGQVDNHLFNGIYYT